MAYARSLSAPRVTNDGATIANELEEVRDPVLDLGLQLMRRAAQTADDTSGDGTTTAVVLAQAIVHRGLYNIAAGANGVRLRDGLERGAAAAIAALRDLARPVESTEQLRHVATVSSEDEPLGRLIAEMAAAVGPDGLIMADFHRGTGRLQARYIDGMQIDRGWLSPFFNEGASRIQVSLETAIGPADRSRPGPRACARARAGQAAPEWARDHLGGGQGRCATAPCTCCCTTAPKEHSTSSRSRRRRLALRCARCWKTWRR